MITIDEMANWLAENEKDYERFALVNILDEFKKNKENILEKFRKHANWDEDAMAIILKESKYNRGFNKKAIKNFYNWCEQEIRFVLIKEDKETEINKLRKEVKDIKSVITFYTNTLRQTCSELKLCPMIDGDPMIYPFMDLLKEKTEELDKYTTVMGYDVPKEIGWKYLEVLAALDSLTNANDYLMTKDLADEVNEIIDVKAVEGQKISKVIRKVCCHAGLDQIKKINDYGSFTRDDGFNRQYAMLCDEINPIEYKRITVISINPLDYWSMSHGKNWKSCHYVGNDDDGCYSSGTESYMLDKTSIIYYIIDENYDGNEYYSQPKEKRCVFCIDEKGNAILQSRVYPDGRDGGDQTLSTQFRTVMQKVVSELWERNNYWDLKKGKENCREYTETKGTHYPDYTYYNDCNVSINKDAKEPIKIRIGHNPICPECGYTHDITEDISCCKVDKTTCDYCGDRFNYEDEGLYCEDNGNYYCCDECAERDDVHYCEDDGYYHDENNCYYDGYRQKYISGEPEVEIDGCCYSSVEDALEDGWDVDYYTNDWYRKEDMLWCEDEGVYIYPDNGDYVWTEDDSVYTSAEQAERYGYVHCEDDVWVSDEDAICTVDDTFYSSEEATKEDGYTENEEGEWVKESEVA